MLSKPSGELIVEESLDDPEEVGAERSRSRSKEKRSVTESGKKDRDDLGNSD